MRAALVDEAGVCSEFDSSGKIHDRISGVSLWGGSDVLMAMNRMLYRLPRYRGGRKLRFELDQEARRGCGILGDPEAEDRRYRSVRIVARD
jgi:hypothetical protein